MIPQMTTSRALRAMLARFASVLVCALLLGPAPALAHKVIASVYPAGDHIEGEIGFSNGDMAANATVEITAPDGSPLGQAQTDQDGLFTFTPQREVAHLFRADLGAGHVAQTRMEASEIAPMLALQAQMSAAGLPIAGAPPAKAETSPTAPPQAAPQTAPASGTAAGLSVADKLAIAQMVRDETRPLRQEIAAYKEHNNLQTVLGGIGYILGLFGIGFYVAARRRLAG